MSGPVAAPINHTLYLLRDEGDRFSEDVQKRFEQLDRVETAVVGMSYSQVTKPASVRVFLRRIGFAGPG